MPDTPYNLNDMDPNSFEHMANALAIKVLGGGLTTFGPGADGGRDGLFHGEAEYPSSSERWSGEWYIQSKYHKPNLSTNHNKWLIAQIKEEIELFSSPASAREWPDNWIIITNVNFSAVPKTGAFDVIKSLIKKANPKMAERFSIWGGDKVSALLATNKDVAEHYGSFITPGDVLASLYHRLTDDHAGIKDIIRYLVVSQFSDQQFTKLEQAGSSADNRPGIHKLFRDIPFTAPEIDGEFMAAQKLAQTLAQNHALRADFDLAVWQSWQRDPSRARVWFIKGGPGQGKSTLTQYFCQIQRAAIILGDNKLRISAQLKPVVNEIKDAAAGDGLWPKMPRVPVVFELREYAKWIARQEERPVSVLRYLTDKIEETSSQKALAGTLKAAFSMSRWLFIFDGMDEVPGDVKDTVAKEISYFVDDLLVGCGSDAHIICTSRPQGYSGQFDSLDAADIRLTSLSPAQALDCARPILEIDRSVQESERLVSILSEALGSQAIREIMTTPLQSHIMAVVVRDGGRPPERKWELFSNFYKVINKREADKSADKKLSALLRGHGKLIKALHNRLGFELHSRAEASAGAQASLQRSRLLEIIEETVRKFQAGDTQQTIETLRIATTDRLVLVNTPENSESVRFDIRPLQEFFAAEYIYESADFKTLSDRVRTIAADSHWREVLHFLLSALIENERRGELAQVIQVLAEVDDPLDEDTRPLARRLALGAQAVTRLLQEGVLEEDQRTRQAFKACLVPVFATTDIWSGLLTVDREYSRAWIIEVLKDVISDQVEPENVGAAAAALCLVNETSKHADELERMLMQSSLKYRSCLFSMLAAERRPAPRRMLTEWGGKLVLRTLLDASWPTLGQAGLRSAYAVLDGGIGLEAARSLGFSVEASEIIDAMLGGFMFREHSRQTSKEIRYGMVNVLLHELPNALHRDNWSKGIYEELCRAGGVVQLAAEVINASSMGPDGARQLLASRDGCINQLRLLPTQILAFLDRACLDADTISSPECAQNLIKSENTGRLESFSLVHSSEQKWDWRGFALKYPDVALHYLAVDARSLRRNEASSIFKDEDSVKTIIDLLQCNPVRTLELSAVWGTIINLIPAFNGQLREVLNQAAKSGIAVFPRYQEEVAPFVIHLPDEACLLPYIVAALVQSAIDNRSGKYIEFIGRKANSERLSRASEKFSRFGLDMGDLINVSLDNAYSPVVQASAHVLSLLISEDIKITHSDLQNLTVRNGVQLSPWFLPAVGLVVHELVERGSYDIIGPFGKMLQDTRADYESRLRFDPLISKWREITRTPVQNSSPDIWY